MTTSKVISRYSPVMPHIYQMDTIIALNNGVAVWNLMWLALEFSKGVNFGSKRGAQIPKMAWRTVNCLTRTGEYINPFSPESGNEEVIADLLAGPAADFVYWLEVAPKALIARLPMTELLGPTWIKTARSRVATCADHPGGTVELAEVRSLLAKFML